MLLYHPSPLHSTLYHQRAPAISSRLTRTMTNFRQRTPTQTVDKDAMYGSTLPAAVSERKSLGKTDLILGFSVLCFLLVLGVRNVPNFNQYDIESTIIEDKKDDAKKDDATTVDTTKPTANSLLKEPSKLPPIDKQTIKAIAPNYQGEWSDEAVHNEFQQALQKIRDAPIIHEPFDHFHVPNLFSDKFYQALMKELPPPDEYTAAPYPGTKPFYNAYHLSSPDLLKTKKDGHVHLPKECFNQQKFVKKHNSTDINNKRRKAGCWLEEVQLHNPKATQGLTLTVDKDASKYPLWVQAFRLVHSRNFTHTMYEKFSTPTGIPQYKQKQVTKQAQKEGVAVANLRNTAALRIEPTSYHLTPHVDRYEKLVTWQFFHPQTFELENRTVGTQFYRLKPEYEGTFEINDQLNPEWLDYSHFQAVKHQPVIPNYFFSFAPNKHSWHGAAIDPAKMEGVDQHSRRTFLGFITTTYWGFHHFNQDDWAQSEFDFVASVE